MVPFVGLVGPQCGDVLWAANMMKLELNKLVNISKTKFYKSQLIFILKSISKTSKL